MFRVNPFQKLMATAVMALALSACANLNPIAVAETPEQKFAAVKLTYDALLTPAVQLIQDETAPLALRRALQDAVATSGDTYKALNAAYTDYLVAREAFSGAEKAQRLAVVGASLEGWIAALEKHIDTLAAALKR